MSLRSNGTPHAIRCLLLGGLLLACGKGPTAPARAYSCAPGGLAPPARLILHSNAVAGQYQAIFVNGVLDIDAESKRLADRYGGTVFFVFAFEVSGFYVKMPDANAQALSEEPEICYVEQLTPVHSG